MSSRTRIGYRCLAACVALLAMGLTGCPLTATWNADERAEAVATPYGTLGVPVTPAGDAGFPDGGGGEGGVLPPRPATSCGDRRGPAIHPSDLVATCAFPADEDVVAAAARVPLALTTLPELVLGDEAMFQTSQTAFSLYDLYQQKPARQLTLAGTYVPGTAFATDALICAIVHGNSAPLTRLQCFERSSGTPRFEVALPTAVTSQATVFDVVVGADKVWVAYCAGAPGACEVVAFALANGQVVWSKPNGTGAISLSPLIRIGDDLVGYDPRCAEHANKPCLRAMNATSGQVIATVLAEGARPVWKTASIATFFGISGWSEYDSGSHAFRDVTADLQPFVMATTGAGFHAAGDLPGGRALIRVEKATGAQVFMAVDLATRAFVELGPFFLSYPRVHGDVLAHDEGLVSLSGATPPTATTRRWFGIFGFKKDYADIARRTK